MKKTKRADGSRDAREALEELVGPLTFGKILNAIRLGDELSLEAFAAKLGVSRAYLCDVEKGRRGVSVARAAEWASMLGESEPQFIRYALQAELNEAGLKWRVELQPTG